MTTSLVDTKIWFDELPKSCKANLFTLAGIKRIEAVDDYARLKKVFNLVVFPVNSIVSVKDTTDSKFHSTRVAVVLSVVGNEYIVQACSTFINGNVGKPFYSDRQCKLIGKPYLVTKEEIISNTRLELFTVQIGNKLKQVQSYSQHLANILNN